MLQSLKQHAGGPSTVSDGPTKRPPCGYHGCSPWRTCHVISFRSFRSGWLTSSRCSSRHRLLQRYIAPWLDTSSCSVCFPGIVFIELQPPIFPWICEMLGLATLMFGQVGMDQNMECQTTHRIGHVITLSVFSRPISGKITWRYLNGLCWRPAKSWHFLVDMYNPATNINQSESTYGWFPSPWIWKNMDVLWFDHHQRIGIELSPNPPRQSQKNMSNQCFGRINIINQYVFTIKWQVFTIWSSSNHFSNL